MTRREWLIAGLIGVLGAIGITVWGLREHWDTGISVGVAALTVSVAGFAIAITEIRKSISATRATKRAVAQTLRGVAASRLNVTITLLRQAATDLEDATTPDGARRAINTWRSLGSEAEGPLRRRFGEDLPALTTLHESIEIARSVKGALEEGKPIPDVTQACRIAMEAAVDQLAPLLDQLLPMIEEDDDEHA